MSGIQTQVFLAPKLTIFQTPYGPLLLSMLYHTCAVKILLSFCICPIVYIFECLHSVAFFCPSVPWFPHRLWHWVSKILSSTTPLIHWPRAFLTRCSSFCSALRIDSPVLKGVFSTPWTLYLRDGISLHALSCLSVQMIPNPSLESCLLSVAPFPQLPALPSSPLRILCLPQTKLIIFLFFPNFLFLILEDTIFV